MNNASSSEKQGNLKLSDLWMEFGVHDHGSYLVKLTLR